MSSELSNPIYNPPLDPWLTIEHREDELLVLDKPSGLPYPHTPMRVPEQPAPLRP